MTQTNKQAIRVLIADDYDILRSGLMVSMRMFPDIQIVGEAANGEQVIAQCRALNPDVILMDLVMPGMNGIAASQTIQAQFPRIKIIALTSFDNEHYVEQMVKASACGYLLKNVSPHELAQAIRAVYRGERVFADEAIHALVHAAQRPTTASLRLTEREREVLKLIITGASNSEIAQALTVSESTAKKHVSAILLKLGVVSRAEAIAFTLHHNLDLEPTPAAHSQKSSSSKKAIS